MSSSSIEIDQQAPGSKAPASTAVATWLLLCCALVFCMIVLGGVTRLTDSGLSMVRWEPVSGIVPPLSAVEWQKEFDHYREYPEYQKINVGMTLDEFKSIFYFEWAHRVLGRVIGLVFAGGFLWLWWKRRLTRALVPHLLAMFVLGGFQGLLGWYMVKSGLVNNPDVSQYRLTAHLGTAILIYLYMLWVAFSLLERRASDRVSPGYRGGAIAVGALAALTVLSGGFVAGLKAGHAFNTFPLMAGQWIPPGYAVLEPFWRNVFENIPTVQFHHRLLAIITLIATGLFVVRALGDSALSMHRRLISLLGVVVLAQVGIGITTLVTYVPIPLAAVHQAMALIVLSVMLYTVFRFRRT
ncbi:MAG: COX15/CtaA family protein [Gammaproteobacteria bacterium]